MSCVDAAGTGAAPLIRLRHVCKRYGSGATELMAMKSIDLDIGAGEFVAIMGLAARANRPR